jgi:CBS domain-containing protein
MHDRKVGTLVVCDAERKPVGILTDRDLAVRVVAGGLDPGSTPVAAVMTKGPRCVNENTSIETALSTMRAGPFRRLPVTNEQGKLLGVISLDDILALLTEEFQEIGLLLSRENPKSLAECA